MTKKRVQKLLVVFDTNVLYTQVASDLLRNDTQRIIEENSNHMDLDIVWCLPEVVLGERRHQMLGKASELLPNMQKLERLLGHKFGVGEDTLELHVDRAINDSVEKHKISRIGIDASEIDWDDLIQRSVRRRPPFEPNEKEKGFRDAIIAQSFLRLQKSSPTTPNICRLALVSEDQRLREYVSELTSGSSNVRILKGLDELESLINTLVSTIPEELAKDLKRKAGKIFFEKENDKTLFYKDSIGEKIREKYSDEFKNTILSNHLRSNGTWWISEPIFIKKDRQTLYWVTPVEPEFEIYHFDREENNLGDLAKYMLEQSKKQNDQVGVPRFPVIKPPVNTLLGDAMLQKKVVDLRGREKFEVHWSAKLSQAQNLTSPKFIKIDYSGNDLPDDAG